MFGGLPEFSQGARDIKEKNKESSEAKDAKKYV